MTTPTPLPEYPRPALQRVGWQSLNGWWDYAITTSPAEPAQYPGQILVPYSPEAPLSGVGRQLQPGEWLHYRRTFAVYPGTEPRVLLHFGAVDYECVVYLNGQELGRHAGGYLPFTFELTAALRPGENQLHVAVQDPTDTGHQARGKQKLKSGGMFYTAQSGIWQTVWLERVPQNYIREIKITPVWPAPPDGEAHFDIALQADTPGGAVLHLLAGGETIAAATTDEQGRATLPIPPEHRRPWTPETPFLYDITATLPGGDAVQSYCALRQFGTAPDANGILRFTLNGKPYFFHGLLDQGYWPQGLYTPPSDAALVQDIRTAKALGFNLLRKHAKVEPQRWYYHCDRLGMVVWQDMPNGGGSYRLWFVTYLTNALLPLLRRLPDRHYRLLARTEAAARLAYYEELRALVHALYNHPCIGCWVPFNEGWGQFDAPKATALLHAIDPTRPVDEASGWYDQGGGEVYSVHNYFYPLHLRPHRDRVVALTEYGGIAWPCPGHTPPQKTFGYGTARTAADLAARYQKLLLRTVLPQIKNGLSALVYTQLSDVEGEVNGILTYDRAVTKLEQATAQRCAAALQAEFARLTAPNPAARRQDAAPVK